MIARTVSLPVFDPESAANYLGLKRDDVLQLAGLFLQDIEEWKQELVDAADKPLALRSAAHRLKSEAANVGAQALRATAFSLENAAGEESDSEDTENLRLLLIAEIEAFAAEAVEQLGR